MKASSMTEVPVNVSKTATKTYYRKAPAQPSPISTLKSSISREPGSNLKKKPQRLTEISRDYLQTSNSPRSLSQATQTLTLQSPKLKKLNSNIPSLTSTCTSESQNKDDIPVVSMHRSHSPIFESTSEFTNTLNSPKNAQVSVKNKPFWRKDRGILASLVSPDSDQEGSTRAAKANKNPRACLKKHNTGVMFIYDLWSDKQFKECVKNTGLSLQTGEKVLTEGLTFKETKEVFKNIYSRRYRRETQNLRRILRGEPSRRASPVASLTSIRSVASLTSIRSVASLVTDKSQNSRNSVVSSSSLAIHDDEYYSLSNKTRGFPQTKAKTLKPNIMIDTSYQTFSTLKEYDMREISPGMERNLKGEEASHLYFSYKGVKSVSSCNSPVPSLSTQNIRTLNLNKKQMFKQNVSNIIRECENYHLDKELLQKINQHRTKIQNRKKETTSHRLQEADRIETLNSSQSKFQQGNRIAQTSRQL